MMKKYIFFEVKTDFHIKCIHSDTVNPDNFSFMNTFLLI